MDTDVVEQELGFPVIVKTLGTALRQLKEKGFTIILVEQNIKFARRASNRFAILNRGSVAVSDDIKALSDDLIHQHLVV